MIGNRKPIVAVDLDGTILSYDSWKGRDHFGQPVAGVVAGLQRLRDKGAIIIVYTCRGNLSGIVDALTEHKIPFDYINSNPLSPNDGSRKIVADVYLDDRGIRFKDWTTAPEEVLSFLADKGAC